MQQGCDRLPVLRIKRSVHLIQQVEWRRVDALDGEDEGEGDERLLASAELAHRPWLVIAKLDLDLQLCALSVSVVPLQCGKPVPLPTPTNNALFELFLLGTSRGQPCKDTIHH